jgi:predicted ATPase
MAYARAVELAREAGETPELGPALFGLYVFSINRAELGAAHQIGEELLDLGERRADGDATLLGHRILGCVRMFQAEFAPALSHLGEAIARYDPARHAPSIVTPADTRAQCNIFTAWILLFQGYPDRAATRSRDALDYARELRRPYPLAFGLHTNCLFHQVRGDAAAVYARSEELITLAAEQGFPHLLATGTFFRAWATLAAGGAIDVAIAEMRRGLAAKRATGAELKVPYYLGLLSDAHRRAGDVPAALQLIEDAFERAERTGERWFEPELHRLRGKALLISSELGCARDAAEASFRRALSVAGAQGTHLWELRAATSLVRLWRDQGKRADARDLLAPVYGWFTEGFDTPDLKNAKALLDELS